MFELALNELCNGLLNDLYTYQDFFVSILSSLRTHTFYNETKARIFWIYPGKILEMLFQSRIYYKS